MDLIPKMKKKFKAVTPSLTTATVVTRQDTEENREKLATEEVVIEYDGTGNDNTDARLYILTEMGDDTASEEERHHTILHLPSSLPNTGGDNIRQTLNIIMLDVSGSMYKFFKELMPSWNKYVAPVLIGRGSRTIRYVFSNDVSNKGNQPQFYATDYKGDGTNLILALKTIDNEVYSCLEKHIKVFFITDGHHCCLNYFDETPESVIDKMQCPIDKTCEVFVLGIGPNYPVNHSLDIRAKLHNGNPNIPYLFQATDINKLADQMEAIKSYNESNISEVIQLSVKGSLLPGGPLTNSFHLGEFIHLPQPVPKQTDGCCHLILTYNHHGPHPQPQQQHLYLKPDVHSMTLEQMDSIFSQWNSNLIQISRINKHQPESLQYLQNIMELETRIFSTWQKKNMRRLQQHDDGQTSPTISTRLARLYQKENKTLEANFKVKLKNLKDVLTQEKFHDEQELASKVLKTSVSGGKFAIKAMKLKGHTEIDYQKDCGEFVKIYNAHKSEIAKLKIDPDDCCRITLGSTLGDLQDPDFLSLMKLDKFELLKTLNISGIPVYTGIANVTVMNPWAYNIWSILKSPYDILSQVSLESFAETGLNEVGETFKEIYINETTCFNAIIPVFKPEHTKIMSALAKTRFYATLATFCVSKTPFITDFNAHLGALASLWLKYLHEYPTRPRPEFVSQNMLKVEATATDFYLDSPGLNKYWEVLKSEEVVDAAQALMTESSLPLYEEKTIKCESLTKPMFIMYLKLRNDPQPQETVIRILKLILVEFVGRYVSKWKKEELDFFLFSTPLSTPFSTPRSLGNSQQKDEAFKILENKSKELAEIYNIQRYYTFHEVKKDTKQVLVDIQKQLMHSLSSKKVNISIVENFRNASVTWKTLKTFAQEVLMVDETTSTSAFDELFSECNLLRYIVHALKYSSSRDRLGHKALPVDNYESSLTWVNAKIMEEYEKGFHEWGLTTVVEDQLRDIWIKSYMKCHMEVVQPMLPEEIMQQAKQRSIVKSTDKFDDIYRYSKGVCLLRNACQASTCPHFLVPSKQYNQHLSVERSHLSDRFPHALHITAHIDRDKDVNIAIDNFIAGKYRTEGGVLKNKIRSNMIGKYICNDNYKCDLVFLHKKYKDFNKDCPL